MSKNVYGSGILDTTKLRISQIPISGRMNKETMAYPNAENSTPIWKDEITAMHDDMDKPQSHSLEWHESVFVLWSHFYEI